MKGLLAATAGFVGVIMILVLSSSLGMPNVKGSYVKSRPIFHSPSEIPSHLLGQFDAVLVLGGGAPTSLEKPPLYVRRRCDDAAQVVKAFRVQKSSSSSSSRKELPVLCLSAGTAHMPQLLSPVGLPIWESTASAAYLQSKHQIRNLFVETSSYDTIGNAWFARTTFADIMGWRRLLIVTNEVRIVHASRRVCCADSLLTVVVVTEFLSQFHMERSKAIFDWIFGLGRSDYDLSYLASPDVGLSEEAIQARREKEIKSLRSVEALAKTYQSLPDVWTFLNEKHDLYTASKLIERGRNAPVDGSEALFLKSYGAE